MAFCGNCGASLSQGTGFCGVCGANLTSPAQPTIAAAPAPPSMNTVNAGWTSVAAAQPATAASSAPSWTPVSNQQNAAPQTPPASSWSAPAAAGAPAQGWNAAPPAAAAVSGTALTPNIAGALAYSLGIITGILFLVLEPYRRDRFVRFHAMQSILYFVAAVAFNIVWSIMVGFLISISGWIAVVSIPIRLLISLALFGLWLFLMFQAYSQREFRIPILGAIAAKQAGS
ncbi:hypothetical protein P8935_02450 [Telmatobacter sp. DSM 110680]|uniref:Zinc-ribbon domain-containing protein n=1 Tax=Telmatobacter sp. DSM 110680 TaxID=3036704 RepID=A0AAU7DLL3_9BACT